MYIYVCVCISLALPSENPNTNFESLVVGTQGSKITRRGCHVMQVMLLRWVPLVPQHINSVYLCMY